ncbi:MAG: cell division protein ZapB [Candidatus Aminicenantes bacterium]|nr:cell division protein ZapB [Candidatus Aminicenantes bacterium]
MTSELERIKILEGKITQIVEHFSRLSQENARLKDELKHLKADKKELEERLRKAGSLEEELKRLQEEKEEVRSRIEALITQMEKLGV